MICYCEDMRRNCRFYSCVSPLQRFRCTVSLWDNRFRFCKSNAYLPFSIISVFERFKYTKRKSFECSCGRTYSQIAGLRKHQRYECGKSPSFKCYHCPHMTHRKSNLDAHIRRMHLKPRLNWKSWIKLCDTMWSSFRKFF